MPERGHFSSNFSLWVESGIVLGKRWILSVVRPLVRAVQQLQLILVYDLSLKIPCYKMRPWRFLKLLWFNFRHPCTFPDPCSVFLILSYNCANWLFTNRVIGDKASLTCWRFLWGCRGSRSTSARNRNNWRWCFTCFFFPFRWIFYEISCTVGCS